MGLILDSIAITAGERRLRFTEDLLAARLRPLLAKAWW
jgi:hypothetical protein